MSAFTKDSLSALAFKFIWDLFIEPAKALLISGSIIAANSGFSVASTIFSKYLSKSFFTASGLIGLFLKDSFALSMA